MTFAEARKAVIAVLGGITSVIPQVLASLGGIIPTEVASWLTIIAAVATAILVYMVPNAPADPLAKVRTSIDALGPVFDVIRQRVRDEVEARVPQAWTTGAAGGSATFPSVARDSTPPVQSRVRSPESARGSAPPVDPFTVPPV